MHTPVLLQEVLFFLHPSPNEDFVDATLGLGGHTSALLEKTAPHGRVFAFEQDPENRELASKHLVAFGKRALIIPHNFVTFASSLRENGVEKVKGVLFDLGVSSVHLDERERGFSFRHNGPLDMRFDRTAPRPTAAEIVNSASVEELARIFREYGEVLHATRLATEIFRARRKTPFRTTGELANCIAQHSPPGRQGGGHPATLPFQALRIAVNDELRILEDTLPQTIEFLQKGARLAVISFHSLEDRIVKKFFRTYAPLQKAQKYPSAKQNLPSPPLKVLTPQAILPSRREIEENPRARSARLRVAEKIF